VHNFISIGQGVTVGRGSKIACSHRKAESSIILHCTTVHAVMFTLWRRRDITSGVFRGGGGGGATAPPPFRVIRGVMGGVWLSFQQVYKEKWEKLLKKEVVKIFRTVISGG
jgi:hypothetical protein